VYLISPRREPTPGYVTGSTGLYQAWGRPSTAREERAGHEPSHITFRRRVRRGALALAVSAICLPSSALAQGDTKFDYPGSSPQPVAPKVGDTPADFPDMPDGRVVGEPVSGGGDEARGFDWTSAAIGAAGAGLLVVVSLGGAGAASRLRMRMVRS
jgi:hypothetical protein